MGARDRIAAWLAREREAERPSIAARALAPLGSVYGFASLVRAVAYETGYLTSSRLTRPVISIGNITMGGTGKTPLVAMLATYLRDQNYEVVILTRGYGRRERGRVALRSESGEMPPDAVARGGDEPALLAREVPGVTVVVDADRVAAGRWAEEALDPDVFLLDDGFQHLRLARDLDLLVLDATDPFGGYATPPLGRLREPVQGAKRADAVVVTRADRPFDDALIRRVVEGTCREGVPILYTWHDLVGMRPLAGGAVLPASAFRGRRVAVLTALGNPDIFLADLEHVGIEVVAERLHADHHEFEERDVAEAVAAARAAGADAVLVTEKDAVKIERLDLSAVPFFAARIEVRGDQDAMIKSLCLKAILRHGSGSGERP